MSAERCSCGAELPTRARVHAVLSKALEQLNRAKLLEAGLGKLPLASIQRLGALAHAVLLACGMLEHCETCINREITAAAALIAGRLSAEGRRE